jgi:threonine/homoserine/homoserine lactone efflux protein
MFFLVVAPRFLGGQVLSLRNALLLSLVSTVIATAIHCAIILAGSKAQAWLADSGRTQWVRRMFAVIMLGVAGSFLLMDIG